MVCHHLRVYGMPKSKYLVASRRFLRGVTLVVIRMDRSGNLCMSKPCLDCIQVIRDVGISKVMYSTGDPSKPFITESTTTLTNPHRTSYTLSSLLT